MQQLGSYFVKIIIYISILFEKLIYGNQNMFELMRDYMHLLILPLH